MIAVYEWGDWENCLLVAMFPTALRINARIGEDAASAIRRVPNTVKTLIFHVDLTDSSRVPTDRFAMIDMLARRDIEVLNGRLTNISKRCIQEVCAAKAFNTVATSPSGDDDELVIVKTDRNYGGKPEKRLNESERDALHQSLPESPPRRGPPAYAVVRRGDVPTTAWTDRDLVVENYISNKANRIYKVFIFLDRIVVSVGLDAKPVKRMEWGTPNQQFFFSRGAQVAAPPQLYSDPNLSVAPTLLPLVVAFRKTFFIDFGSIDVAEDNLGSLYVIDVNSTPGWGRPDLPGVADFLGNDGSLIASSYDA